MFETYVPPTQGESDAYKPGDNYNHPCIVKVLEYKPSVVTSNSPDGAPAVIVDLVDLTNRAVYRNVLMMTGAIVDGFKAHAGTNKPLVVWWSKATSKAGRDYAVPMPGSPDHIAAATAWYSVEGDPFAPQFGAPTPQQSEAPF